MKIIRADILGFCSGVRRAVNAAERALGGGGEGGIYTLGPLIHNPTVLKKFAERGLKVLDGEDFGDLKADDTVLIRAHGVPPETENALKSRVKNVVNATCPLVSKSQRRAAEFAGEGFNIIFAGDPRHGEVAGIEGYALEAYRAGGFEPNFLLVRNLGDLKGLFDSKRIDFGRRTVLLSQTTFSIPIFEEMSSFLAEKIPDAKIFSSICPATHERQAALERLCARVEGVLVIGGRASANTNRLFSTAKRLCARSALIESAAEIPVEFFSLGAVGITAGASTPDGVIEDVENSLKNSSL